MLEEYIVSETASYVLYIVLMYYWLGFLSQKISKYDSSRHWAQNAFLENGLLFVYNTFYRVPYLLYAVLEFTKMDTSIYLTYYWGVVVISLIIPFFLMLIKLRTKPHPSQQVNGKNRKKSLSKHKCQIVENTGVCNGTGARDFWKNKIQFVQEYRSIESAVLDVIIIISILSSTLNLLCERRLTGFLYSFPNLLNITHLGFLIKKKVFSTDVNYFYWIGYFGCVFVVWSVARTFGNCMPRQIFLELYSNVWIIYLATIIAVGRTFDGDFTKDLLFLGKFLVLLTIICSLNFFFVYKNTIVIFLIN